jgi:hypothetical protein
MNLLQVRRFPSVGILKQLIRELWQLRWRCGRALWRLRETGSLVVALAVRIPLVFLTTSGFVSRNFRTSPTIKTVIDEQHEQHQRQARPLSFTALTLCAETKLLRFRKEFSQSALTAYSPPANVTIFLYRSLVVDCRLSCRFCQQVAMRCLEAQISTAQPPCALRLMSDLC